MKKVLVTGADGMLGSNICRQLLHEGFEVHGLVVPGRETGTLDDIDVHKVTGDITNRQDMRNALEGCDALINCAASTQIWPGRSPNIQRVNFEAVKILAELVQELGLLRFIQIGTANSFAPGPKSNPGNETNAYEDFKYRLDYQDSKYAAQEYLIKKYQTEGLPVRIINPTFMFGAYDSKPGAGELLIKLHSGQTPGASPGGKNYVSARAVATAAVNALTMGRDGECYICAGENLSYREAFDRFAAVLNCRSPKLNFPSALVLATGFLGNAVSVITRKEPNLSYAMARIAINDCYYDKQKAVNELQLPLIPVEEAVQECWEWLCENGYIQSEQGNGNGQTIRR